MQFTSYDFKLKIFSATSLNTELWTTNYKIVSLNSNPKRTVLESKVAVSSTLLSLTANFS